MEIARDPLPCEFSERQFRIAMSEVSRRSLIAATAAAALAGSSKLGAQSDGKGPLDAPQSANTHSTLETAAAKVSSKLAISDAQLAENMNWPRLPLKVLAAKKNMRFGTCIEREVFPHATLAQLIAYESSILVAENGFKWEQLRPGISTFDFELADRLLEFAKIRKIPMRGHTLIWDKAIQPWILNGTYSGSLIELMTNHIRAVVGYFGQQIESWDVVNEAIRPSDGKAEGLAANGFLKEAGPEYICIAFQEARNAAPKAELVYNDWIDGYASSFFEDRRTALLKLIEFLKSRNAPVTAVGLQSHLNAGRNDFSEKIWASFCAELNNFGLPILITELDVSDDGLPASPNLRDSAVADCARKYLDVTYANVRVRDVLVWGLTDRYSALDHQTPRRDGIPPRGAPYDANLEPKLLREALARAFEGAPVR